MKPGTAFTLPAALRSCAAVHKAKKANPCLGSPLFVGGVDGIRTKAYQIDYIGCFSQKALIAPPIDPPISSIGGVSKQRRTRTNQLYEKKAMATRAHRFAHRFAKARLQSVIAQTLSKLSCHFLESCEVHLSCCRAAGSLG